MHDLDEFILALRAAKSLDELNEIATTTFARFGITAHTYGGARLPRSGSTEQVIFTTYPDDWAAYYVEQGYQQRDPVVARGMGGLLPFQWSELTPSKAERVVFEEGRTVGLNSGLSVPVHGAAGEFALISLASSMSQSEFSAFAGAHQHFLHLAAIYYHAAVADFTAMKFDADQAIRLTRRESEVLTWIAKGKTAWEISELLRISESTVVFHVENAKRKLGVFGRSYAVAKAIRLGLISL